MALQRIPFTIRIEGFVEIEAHPMPARDPSGKKKHIMAGFEWAKRVANNAEAAIDLWVDNPKCGPGMKRFNFGEPLKELSYFLNMQTGYYALVRKATGEEIY